MGRENIGWDFGKEQLVQSQIRSNTFWHYSLLNYIGENIFPKEYTFVGIKF